MSQTAQMHLVQMLFHTPTNHTIMSWVDEHDGQLEGMGSFSYWEDLARTLERGCFDGVFFADTPAVHDVYEDGPWTSLRHGIAWPTHDPMPLVAAMAAVTERLGLGVTLSVSGNKPYLAARRLSTLDVLSGGRIGWNVVTGHLRAEHNAIGVEQFPHDERYEYAEEFLKICNLIWKAIEDGAITAETGSGIFADTSKIKVVDYQGKYLNCRAVPPTFPSKQGRPVIFQAGSSKRGMRFAIENSEAVFAIQTSLESMQKFMGAIDAAAKDIGVPPSPVLFGYQPVLGSTEEEAQRHHDEVVERVSVPAALSRISGTLGVDLSKLDPDQPLAEVATDASQGLMAAATAYIGGKARTLREFARSSALGGLYHCIGTPEKVADDLEALWRKTGCHGFNISQTINPRSVQTFVDEVVPILQKRGIFRTEYAGETFRDNLLN